MLTRWAVLPLILALACGPGVASGGTDSSSSGSDDGSTGTEDDGVETGSWNECDCTDAEICVADCHAGPPFGADYYDNFRCVDAQACIELGPHTRECVEAACGSAWRYCHDDRPWADLLCSPDSVGPCDELVNDCPEGEKCVVTLDGEWPNVPSRCGWSVGEDAPGEPCSSFDNYLTDTCISEAMCWSGELVAGPFEGTCQPFCDGTEDPPSCPDGLACVLIAPDFHLCI